MILPTLAAVFIAIFSKPSRDGRLSSMLLCIGSIASGLRKWVSEQDQSSHIVGLLISVRKNFQCMKQRLQR